MLKWKKKGSQQTTKEPVSPLFLLLWYKQAAVSVVISADFPGPLSAWCGFHKGGCCAFCHSLVLPGHRLTCQDSCEWPCKQVRAELKFFPFSGLRAGAGPVGALSGWPAGSLLDLPSTPIAQCSPTPQRLVEPAVVQPVPVVWASASGLGCWTACEAWERRVLLDAPTSP